MRGSRVTLLLVVVLVSDCTGWLHVGMTGLGARRSGRIILQARGSYQLELERVTRSVVHECRTRNLRKMTDTRQRLRPSEPFIRLDGDAVDAMRQSWGGSSFSPPMVERMVEELARNHFFVLRLEGESADKLESLRDVGREFFSLPQEEKNRVGRMEKVKGLPGGSIGFARMDSGEKPRFSGNEFLSVRAAGQGNIVPSLRLVSQRADSHVFEACDMLSRIGLEVLRELFWHLGLSKEEIRDWIDTGNHPEGGALSMSEQRFCFYNSKSPCSFEPHVDLTFLTIIPASSQPGLEVLDSCLRWQRPESDLRLTEKDMLVLSGQTLQLFSGGAFPASIHRVVCESSSSPNGRYSCPLLLRGKKDKIQIQSKRTS
ncbi:hypothetical protein GUITHDRAFT_104340 [Guillardia theta CCMP2712]|uniref:Isopenicillin N synthase-like Fe(2+) 2OG dioxygenase domain-containing protein n=1 Tax=Guillardia theta (strain CCMP2712) TaxID=905079 RepID=L1JPF2_GUITC|nr:hypothetical protein GUITHDRAFT_104340 [Guillardia theta CCMP2712]EKX49943.1 hypothetical protein GUITHDRAFT_104340 [Guillardia theta CCMP2712]|eukprot:XP_005836923.1 hypothetical protein GUITHDRAFT_104340 [Guillardia theta CCMP2712]